MTPVKIVVRNTDGSSSECSKLLVFNLKKEAYQRYSILSARMLVDSSAFDKASEIRFYISGKLVHHGLIDSIKTLVNGGKQITTLTSRGFTSLLCQNQIEPGMKTGVSINSLMDGFYSLPYVEHEDNSDTSNYIFVKNNSTMWDALANLSYKLCGTYPYVRGTNTVRITPMSTPESYTYSASDLLTMGEEFTFRRLISDFHMADINGDHGTYSLSDSDVPARGIVRHKYFELDRQFLYDPQQALEYRDKYAYRGFKRSFCSYSGYNGEELSDIVTFGKIKSARIGCVEITGSQKGVITEISTYNDKFT